MHSSSQHILRPLGPSALTVSPVSLGTWPIAGVKALDVNDVDSLATIRACFDLGINFIDTAYCYGPNGESENLLRQALVGRRDEMVLATKGGIHYDASGTQTQDAQPETLLRECDESLRRLGTDRVELYYLHAPDPNVPIAESAGAIRDLMAAGKVLAAGASNCNLEQLREFHAACPLTAVQLPYNMLQRDIERQTVPWCRENDIAVIVYWTLMKGLLAGRLTDLDQLPASDARRKYPMYQGDEWAKNLAFVDKLRAVADECGRTVAELVINWTIHQPGVTVALCGAKRPAQLADSAAAMSWQLTPEQNATIAAAIAARGKAAAKRLFQ
jgi:aryl-alcohol dehydrogenase-like predicted oxidoreductase